MKTSPKIKLFFFCLAFFFSFNSICFTQNEADSTLIPFEVNEKWGYINNKGKIVIKPQFDEADKFSEGLARAQIELKSGFIDSKGKFVIEPIYTFAFSFSEGLAVVGKDMDSRWFYIDHNGKTAIEPNPKFIWLGSFNDGLAQFSMNIGGNSTDSYDARSGFIDKTGKIVIQPKFADAEAFSDALAVVSDDKPNKNTQAYFNKKTFIDTKGNILTPFFDSAENFSEGLAAVEINNYWGFIDKTGKIVIDPQFDFILREFSEGIAFVHCKNDKVGAIDKTGKMITGCIFDESWGFSEGLAPVQVENKKWGFINSKGKFVLKPQFDYAQSFFNGLAQVGIKKGKWGWSGFINHNGNFVFKRKVSMKKEKSDNKIEDIE